MIGRLEQIEYRALRHVMWVFIKGIPNAITGKELFKLVSRQFNPVWSITPIKGVKIEDCKILKIKRTRSRTWECYGLVYISPSKLVHAAIGRLNTARLNGKRVQAHPYVSRDRSRDRRQQAVLEEPYPGDRRQYDRRRAILVSQISDLDG